MINHIVLFKFKKNVCLKDIKKLETEFLKLKKYIPEILSITSGDNISKEGFSKGFTKGFLLSFKSVKSLNIYLVSKEHTLFVKKYIEPIIDDVLVFDYKI